MTYGVRSIQNEDQEIGRLDWIHTTKHTAFGRYFTTSYQNPAPFDSANFLATSAPGIDTTVYAFTYGDNYTFTPNLLNSFHATSNRRYELRSQNATLINPRTIGINVFIFTPNDLHVTVANDLQVGCSTCAPATYGINMLEFSDDVDWIKGNHHIGFGASLTPSQTNVNGGFFLNGQYAFNGIVTGDAMADYLTETTSSFSQSRSLLEALREWIVSPYIQGTFHVRPNLVVNAGLRWEPHTYPNDYLHRGSSFSLANFLNGVYSTVMPAAPAGQLFYGEAGIPGSFAKTNWINLSPRLGLAWDLSGNGRETLRVGAGIMYDTPEVFGNSHIPFPITKPFFPQFGAFVVSPGRISNVKMSQWNFIYQRQLGNNWVVSGSYIGNRTNHLQGGLELDPALNGAAVCAQFSTGCTTANTSQRRVLYQLIPASGQYYGSVLSLDSGSNARYNGMLLSANHRLTHGISVLANYTWSHCTSDLDYGGDIDASSFMNPSNCRQDTADCEFDVRHIFNASLIDVVGFKSHNLLRKLIGQWQIAPLVRALSGIPLNVVSGTDRSLTGIGLDRPNYNGTVSPYTSSSNPLQYLNAAAFTLNAPGTFGDLGPQCASWTQRTEHRRCGYEGVP